MRNQQAMARMFELSDIDFFYRHPDRQARIRKCFLWESEKEFRSLGDHKRDRRRVILWKVPEDNPFYDPGNRGLLKIPFLAFADESIEDDDAVLLPLLDQIMLGARVG